MIAVVDKMPITFDQFIEWYPDTSGSSYELRRGVIVPMPKPKGKHSEIAGFLIKRLNYLMDEIQAPYFIPRECIVKVSDDTGYEPDVVVLDRPALVNEPRWNSASVIVQGKSVKLGVEVVSSNWRDDYGLKLSDYERLGIEEYWIVDYWGVDCLEISGRRYIGSPKQPTLSICHLVDGEYEMQRFRQREELRSSGFPTLKLTVDQIFNPG
jgi:Uma2 family endonuclease